MQRWDQLVADLSARAEELDRQRRSGEVAERLRHEVGRLTAVDRLRTAAGGVIAVACEGDLTVRGVLVRVASDALLIQESAHRECLVPWARVLSIGGVPGLFAVPADSPIADRLGLRVLLRAIARDRSAVQVVLRDGSMLAGTIDRVGADFLELAEHAAAEPRRRGAVRQVVIVPLGGLVAVRRGGG